MRRHLLLACIAGQCVVYLVLAFALRATSDATGVFGFLGAMAVLFAAYAGSLRLVQREEGTIPIGMLVAAALLFRLTLLPAGLPQSEPLAGLDRDLGASETGFETFLLYDNDAWRYLWDGGVLAHGRSPYAAAPAELEAAYLASGDQEAAQLRFFETMFEDGVWVEVYDNLSFTGYRTVYGPLAQAGFALCARISPGSITVLKVLLLLFDLGVVFWIAHIARSRSQPALLVAYAWNPLLIKETVGSAHLDIAAVAFVVLTCALATRKRFVGAAVAAAAAALLKLSFLPVVALVALAAMLERGPRGAAAAAAGGATTLAAGLAPFFDDLPAILTALRTFAAEWMFNPGPFLLARRLFDLLGLDGWSVAGGVALLVPAVGSAVLLWRSRDGELAWPPALLVLLGGLAWLGATVNPWYLIWGLPFAVLAGFWPWLVLTATAQLSYLFYLDQTERWVALLMEHGIFAAAVLVWLLERRRTPA